MAWRSRWRSMHLPIRTGSSPKISRTAKTNHAIFVLVRSKWVSLPFASPIAAVSFAFLAPVTGGKARQFMSTKIKYTDEPLGDIKVVQDFLPAPAQLAFREEGVKVTLALSRKSVEFFKSEAAKNNTQYQRMIRRLVDAYVERYAPVS